MALAVGSRLGSYEVVGALGAGGMGEVYRAVDTRLDRQVAIKVLPEAVRADPERTARFEREAKLLASLNHPNIAAIYGLERSSDEQFIVMELVEGPTLADVIARGGTAEAESLRSRPRDSEAAPPRGGGAPRGLEINEALQIAKQIADALEAAHEAGVIHRDLKPANVKVRPDGTVKVLDFGLAKALSGDPLASPVSLTKSPTITSPVGVTAVGTLLGTAAYMSPEQARGRPADKRSDLWAYGCVLYELLTGRRAFEGDHVTDTLAFVITREPDWSALTGTTAPAIRRVLRRCLEKDRNRRLGDAAVARMEIDEAMTTASSGDAAVVAATSPRQIGRERMAWTVAAVLAISLVTALVVLWQRLAPVLPARAVHFSVAVPTGFQMTWGQFPSLAISPDGTKIVFETSGRLYLRSLDGFEAEAISNSDGGAQPFFAPDGAWLGFVRGNTLLKVPTAGGPPVKIADASEPMGVSWGKEGRIIFAGAVGNGGLWSVPADGGTPEQVMKVSDSANETAYAWPDVLPDGSVLFTVLGLSGHAHDARLVVADLTTGVRAVVAEGVTFGRYVEPGFLLYADADGTLLLQPFEVAGRRTVGPARAVLAGARVSSWGGAVPLATSSSGTLVYVTGTELENTFLVQLDLSGRELRRFGQPRAFGSLALSPGGRTLATMTHSSSNDDIFLLDLPSGRFDRFSFDVAEDETPVWSPDGQQLAYSGGGGGEQRRIFVKTIGNAEAPRLVYTGKHHIHLTSWSPDGRWLAFDEINSRSVDIQLLNLQDTTRPVSALTTSADEGNAVFSPDGRWLAYSSKESGRLEVYVVSFPDLGGKHQVSHDGGFQPQWAPNGRELFFFDGYYNFPGRLMRARRLAGSVMSWEAPVTLFDVPRVNDFQVASDGQSIHFIAPNPDAPAREIRVIVNWIEEMKRLVPTK